MRIRRDFVTNSSSSSYIICFARIEDEEKARRIINEYNLEVYDVAGIENEKIWDGDLGADFCGATIYVDKILKDNPNGKFIIIEDSNEAYEDDDGDAIYNYDFRMNDAIDSITKDNGFADIRTAEGEGRDG